MSRRVFITGGSAGLGRALVDHYADAGWSVVTQGRRAADQIAPPLPQHVTYQQHDFARDVGLPAMVTD
ncbi:MAG: SDR family NAD(P)-dependent oxidoreductase, partial [Pseudomonadota bacterium]